MGRVEVVRKELRTPIGVLSILVMLIFAFRLLCIVFRILTLCYRH